MPVNFSNLPAWAHSLASILPLSVLIEFVDFSTQLHVYELRNSVPMWNWPVTPSGARLLLSKEEKATACCLDRPHRSRPLECFDGRWLNRYPASNPTTTRLWLSTIPTNNEIENDHENMADPTARIQLLKIVHLSPDRSAAGPPGTIAPTLSPAATHTEDGKSPTPTQAHPQADTEGGVQLNSRRSYIGRLRSYLKTLGVRYMSISLLGWLGWLALVIICFLDHQTLWVAGVYFLLMPATSIAVSLMLGWAPRIPIQRGGPVYKRLVISTASENGMQWYGFLGDHTLLNGLLNLPLHRPMIITTRWWHVYLIRLFIVAQWALVVGSSSLEDWNALLIFLWVVFCIWTSAYGYPSDVAAIDWLKKNCHVKVETVDVELSSRRALLAALATVNPDTLSTPRMKDWSDRILGSSEEESENWEALLIEIGAMSGPQRDVRGKWWWKYVDEGVKMGKKIKDYERIKNW